MKVRVRKIETTPRSRLAHFAVCGAVVVLIWIVFGQTLSYDFVNYDDKTYVYGNSLISAGLSWHGFARAFVDTQTNNWHPLTLVSHMIDCQLYDLKPGGHHFTNVFLHTIAAVLLFFWLRNITGEGQSGSDWSSAFVTALFAIHPLRVESVAWIAERKDTQRCSERGLFLSDSWSLRPLCPRALSRPLSHDVDLVCLWINVEADAGDDTSRVAAPRLLAAKQRTENRGQRSEVQGGNLVEADR